MVLGLGIYFHRFLVNILISYSLKTQENQSFSVSFWVYEIVTLARNWLTKKDFWEGRGNPVIKTIKTLEKGVKYFQS